MGVDGAFSILQEFPRAAVCKGGGESRTNFLERARAVCFDFWAAEVLAFGLTDVWTAGNTPLHWRRSSWVAAGRLFGSG